MAEDGTAIVWQELHTTYACGFALRHAWDGAGDRGRDTAGTAIRATVHYAAQIALFLHRHEAQKVERTHPAAQSLVSRIQPLRAFAHSLKAISIQKIWQGNDGNAVFG